MQLNTELKRRRSAIKIWVFSIGEPTTELCCELLKEYGFEVILLQDNTTLQQKLKTFYTQALESKEPVVMRIDADIIPKKDITKIRTTTYKDWVCASGYDWYKQDIGAISIHVMSKEIIRKCLDNIDDANVNRPESYVWRLAGINSHTRIDNGVYGIHGYAQKPHRERIKALKQLRGQSYDWQLVERIEALDG